MRLLRRQFRCRAVADCGSARELAQTCPLFWLAWTKKPSAPVEALWHPDVTLPNVGGVPRGCQEEGMDLVIDPLDEELVVSLSEPMNEFEHPSPEKRITRQSPLSATPDESVLMILVSKRLS
jgi:hypothetical protein